MHVAVAFFFDFKRAILGFLQYWRVHWEMRWDGCGCCVEERGLGGQLMVVGG